MIKLASFKVALHGLYQFVKTEKHAKFHLLAALLMTCAGIGLNFNYLEWIAVLVCIAMVITAEIINTAIEKLVDLVSPGIHPLAGLVKDLAAGAVLLSAMFSLAVALILFYQHLM